MLKIAIKRVKTKELKMLSANKINKFTLQIIFKSKKSFYLSFNDEVALKEYKFGFSEITELEFETLKAMIEKEKTEVLELKAELPSATFENKIQIRRKAA